MSARSVLMIRPVAFGPDPETAADNAFQTAHAEEGEPDAQVAAAHEFDALRDALTANGIEVVAIDGTSGHPSDVFPNNWFSTLSDGTLIIYPMKTFSRRGERRTDVIDWLLSRYPQIVDLSGWEDKGMFLEGTGSLVLDHENRIAFAAMSERTNETMVRNWCADFEFEPVLFDTSGPGGKPIYHTNVMLSIGSRYAVVCTECIDQPSHVLSALLTSGRELIEITRSQMMNFCGNILELEGKDGKVIAMSQAAADAFSTSQMERLRKYGLPVAVAIPTIEKCGGGSVRCMLAELH